MEIFVGVLTGAAAFVLDKNPAPFLDSVQASRKTAYIAFKSLGYIWTVIAGLQSRLQLDSVDYSIKRASQSLGIAKKLSGN